MGASKITASLLARFLLCFTLIACLWIVSISYRMGSFDYRGPAIVANNGGGFAASDGLLLAATLALLIGLFGLYRSGRVSAVVMVIVSLVVITFIDHGWARFGSDPTAYKAVPGHVIPPAIAAVLLCPFALLFPAKREADGKQLLGCWGALALTICLLGTRTGHNMLDLQSMIGPTYMQNAFLSLLVARSCAIFRA